MNWYNKLSPFTTEIKLLSWFHVILSLITLLMIVFGILITESMIGEFILSMMMGLNLLRLFSLYHEFNHSAILKKSMIAKYMFNIIGFFLLSPSKLWLEYHEYHHVNNSKFSLEVIGDYPTITCEEFKNLSKRNRVIYIIKRSLFIMFFGYIFIYLISFCINPFLEKPKKNRIGLFCVIAHIMIYFILFDLVGIREVFFLITIPFFIYGFISSLIFYLQHNCSGLIFYKKKHWNLPNAAIHSSSFIKMNLFWRIITANSGFHTIHHLEPKIPFYYLPLVMNQLRDDFKEVKKLNFNLISVYSSIKLKLWDEQNQKLVTLKEYKEYLTINSRQI